MQEFYIGINESGQRLDKYLQKLLKNAKQSFIQKMLRKKNIVLNDKKADGSVKTNVGDCVKIYMTDETIARFRESTKDTDGCCEHAKMNQYPARRWVVPVIYEDANILLVNKPKGLLSQKTVASDWSLVDFAADYALEKGYLTRKELETFSPGICNRLDRNTSGCVLAGLSLPALQILNEEIRKHHIQKYYLCVVKGEVAKPEHVIAHWRKDKKTNQVHLSHIQRLSMDESADTIPFAEKERIDTRFWPVVTNHRETLLKVELLTGKTHQIRAQLEALGHPLVGEKKYNKGNYEKNSKSKEPAFQLLHSWQMIFPQLSEPLAYLSHKCMEAPLPVDFASYLKENGLHWGGVYGNME